MKKIFLTMITLISVYLLVGCGMNKTLGDREISYNGKNYNVASDIKRAVVMDLGFLDIMLELNIDVEVAIPETQLPDYLNSYSDAKKVGGLKTPSEEEIVKFEPDVIILSGRQESYTESFTKIAPTILLEQESNENAIDYMYKNLEFAIDLFKMDNDILENKTALINEKLALAKELIAKSNDKGLILLYNTTFSAYGAGSRFGIIHDVLGVKEADSSIEASTHGQQISTEGILSLNPDRIFIIDRTVVVAGESSSDLFKNSIYDNLDAKKNNKITYLDPVVWYTVSGGYKATLTQIEEIANAYTA